MSGTWRIRAASAAALVLAAGCQNYNFNPVGHCIVQPGTETFTLSNISTADVLFVIDDSGSMAGEQKKLAANFNSFITNLDAANAERAAAGLKPFDFHIAVTTTSVFTNYSPTSPSPTWTCSASCTGATGQVCCRPDGTPALAPRRCTTVASAPTSQCQSATGVGCRTDCSYRDPLSSEYLHLFGETYCCNDSTTAVTFSTGSSTSVTENLHLSPFTDRIPCSVAGALCGTLQEHTAFSWASGSTDASKTYACVPGVSSDGARYPHGAFVGWTDPANASNVNPRVLHFDTGLYGPDAKNRQGFTRTQLVNFFKGIDANASQANVVVGTCGSNQEQGLEAARLAVASALAGTQVDTYSIAGVKTASTAEWPHANSKLVLVFVGDEDDCSSPEDRSGGIVLLPEFAGADACTRNDGAKEYAVATRYADYFKGLGRSVGAAFVVSTAESVCGRPDGTGAVTACTAGKCCQMDCPTSGVCGGGTGTYASYAGSPYYCGGQAAGTRFFDTASAFRTRGADVVMGSICDSSFGLLLDEIAKIVKPPSGLVLPTLPADGDITVLRIADDKGETVKLCGRPLAPASPTNYTLQEAQDLVDAATGKHWDWWFTVGEDAGPPADVSKYVYINPNGSCIANPGETYSAEYIGRLPSAGCSADADCQAALGGSIDSWTCYAGVQADGTCTSTATATGTCVCGARSKNCPNGTAP